MYYVAKREDQFTLNIVESFDDFELVEAYTAIMHCANKGTFVILTEKDESK